MDEKFFQQVSNDKDLQDFPLSNVHVIYSVIDAFKLLKKPEIVRKPREKSMDLRKLDSVEIPLINQQHINSLRP